MGKIVLDKSGNLRKGAFYRFDVQYDDVVEDAGRTPEWIVVPRTPTDDQLRARGKEPWMVIEAEPRDCVKTKDCLADVNHTTYYYYASIEGESYVGQVSPIIPSTDGTIIILSDDLRRRVERIEVRGRKLDPIDVVNHYTRASMEGYWVLQFTGKARGRPPKFIDATNCCPYCGRTKIVCETCGAWTSKCSFCQKYMVRIESERDDGKQVLMEKRPLPVIFEGSTWDGSDLVQANGRNFASKRFIEWLLRIHAAPFYAEPVYFCVDGMNDQQKKWFDDLQKPFEV